MEVNNESELPSLSVIIPALNASKVIGKCLDSIVNQDYPKNKIEILVIDDNSIDNTIEIAKSYGAKILINGNKSIEIGKSIGLKNANNDFIFLIDADNILPTKNWLRKSVEPFLKYPNLVGSEAIWFKYRKKDSITDRYCSLFGINDPMVFYLKKRDRLMQIEKDWVLPGKVVAEHKNYFVVRFNENNLLTVGSQGFITRKELLFKTKCTPYLFHIDSNMDLVKMEYNTYAMMKLKIIHLHSKNIGHFIKKLKRNWKLFLIQRHLRRYKYKTNPIKFFLITLSMITLIRPLYDSLNGFFKKPDVAWFLHPLFCFIVPLMYISMIIEWKIDELFNKLILKCR